MTKNLGRDPEGVETEDVASDHGPTHDKDEEVAHISERLEDDIQSVVICQ